MTVNRMTSFRVGHTTFFNSSYVSRKNVTGVVIEQKITASRGDASIVPNQAFVDNWQVETKVSIYNSQFSNTLNHFFSEIVL